MEVGKAGNKVITEKKRRPLMIAERPELL